MSGPDLLAQHLARVPVHRALIRALEHRLLLQELPLARPLLDIGCGDGHFAAAALPGGIDVGVDVTPLIVREGRANGPYRHAAVASGTQLPFADGSFAGVVSNCVIEHIPDIEALVSEVARVLAPGGRFIFSVPNERFTASLLTVSALARLGLGGPAARYGRWWNRRAVHHHLDSPDSWRARLEAHDLEIVRHERYMSAAATRAFELSHYYAIPSLVWRRVSGRWSLRPEAAQMSLAHRWLCRYAEESQPPDGTCSFYVAEKAAG